MDLQASSSACDFCWYSHSCFGSVFDIFANLGTCECSVTVGWHAHKPFILISRTFFRYRHSSTLGVFTCCASVVLVGLNKAIGSGTLATMWTPLRSAYVTNVHVIRSKCPRGHEAPPPSRVSQQLPHCCYLLRPLAGIWFPPLYNPIRAIDAAGAVC